MKATINGKRYNTEKCRTLASRDHHNNGNYSGTSSLIEASDGTLLVHTDSNGQDCWLQDSLCLFGTEWATETMDDFADITDEERLVELGLIVIVE
jgi:hypothetical protein